MKFNIKPLLVTSLFFMNGAMYGQTWDGDTDNDWNTDANWVGNPAFPNTSTADITFSDIAGSNLSPNISSTITVRDITFNSATDVYTLSSSASQRLNLSANSDITQSGAANATISSEIDLAGNNVGFGGSGAGTLIISGNVVSSAGSLTKTGTSRLRLTGTNAFTGSVTISNGYIELYNMDGLGDTGSATTTTIASGAFLSLAYGASLLDNENFVISGDGGYSNGAIDNFTSDHTITGTVTLAANSSVGVQANSLTLNGVISDGGSNYSLTKVSNGKLNLDGNNTYGGSTNINAGTVEIRHANALGDTGSTTTATTVSSGATLSLNLAGAQTLDRENFTISGTGVSSAGVIDVIDGTWTVGGTIALAGDSTIDVNTNDQLLLEGVISGSHGITKTGAGRIRLDAANTFTGGVTISDGFVELYHNKGLGDDGVSTTTTTISSGAFLSLAFSSSNNIERENFVISGDGGYSNGAIDNYSSDNTISGNITLAANSSIGVQSNSLTVNGTISDGANDYNLTKVSSGALNLAGNNTYSGSTNINAGIVEIRHANALGDHGTNTTATTVSSGAVLRLNQTGTQTLDRENFTISGTGVSSSGVMDVNAGDWTVSGTVVMSAASTINAANNTSLTLDGILSDGGSVYALTKEGTGTLTLNAANTYTGNTTVSAGTLNLGGSIDGNLTVSGGTVTGGTDANAVAGIFSHTSGTISPNTTGTTGQFNFKGAGASSWTGGTYIWDVTGGMDDSGSNSFSSGDSVNEASGAADGTVWDVLTFTGSLDFTGSSTGAITIDINSYGNYTGYEWGKMNEVKIAEASSIVGFNEAFFNLDTTGFNDATGSWWLDWSIVAHDNALWLQYQAVPEPGTWIAIVGLTLLVLRRRFVNVAKRVIVTACYK